jgi:hypothetical protein
MCAPRSPSVAPTIPFSRVNPSCSRGGSVFSAALTFKRRLMNKPRVKTCGCGLFLLPISARTFRKGSSWLSRHDSGGNSPRRQRGPCVPSERGDVDSSDCKGKTQVPEHRGDSTESGSYSRGDSVWCVLTTGCDGVTRLGLNTPNA